MCSEFTTILRGDVSELNDEHVHLKLVPSF